jgi:hypothetical protein
MPEFGDINWLAVVVAVVASQIIGFIWYGPLFQKQWMAALGKTEADMSGNAGPAIVIGIICSTVITIALALLLTLWDPIDLKNGVKAGLFMAIGFVIPYIVLTTMYEERSRALMWIAVSNQLVTAAVVGGILGAMA